MAKELPIRRKTKNNQSINNVYAYLRALYHFFDHYQCWTQLSMDQEDFQEPDVHDEKG